MLTLPHAKDTANKHKTTKPDGTGAVPSVSVPFFFQGLWANTQKTQ